MGRANGIAAHGLQRLDLTDERSLVHGSTQRAQVVVQADTLQLAGLAVQLETALFRHADRAHAHWLHQLVEELPVVHQFHVRLI